VEQAIVVAEKRSRNRLTGQVILVLLLFAFPLLALLVLEQGRVIDAQRLLIQQLSGDTKELNSIRARQLRDRAKPAAPSAKTPQADTQQQPGAAPERKGRKRRESKQAAPPPPQEYPGTRQVPVRKAA